MGCAAQDMSAAQWSQLASPEPCHLLRVDEHGLDRRARLERTAEPRESRPVQVFASFAGSRCLGGSVFPAITERRCFFRSSGLRSKEASRAAMSTRRVESGRVPLGTGL